MNKLICVKQTVEETINVRERREKTKEITEPFIYFKLNYKKKNFQSVREPGELQQPTVAHNFRKKKPTNKITNIMLITVPFYEIEK